ncbi:MAG TPA: UDP-glucose/GDP-mannose dehydrogenase family protein [Bacilli bacterium]|nr:UDP-glucose/GDP-mannose dehydrogenase family protein [Bacilli bacterium]
MKVAVIGTGYVGATTAIAFASWGHRVTGLDLDARKIALLRQGRLPIYEEGLEELLQESLAAGTLSFSTEAKEAVETSDVILLAVGTPSAEDGSADLSYIEGASRQIGQHLNGYKVIVNKSTVPVGTGDRVREIIAAQLQARGRTDLDFDVASNPEFLREGRALHDALHPERVVLGCARPRAREQLLELYAPIADHTHILCTAIRDAEMIKYASNAFLATKISFVNELARLCEQTGADILHVAKGMGLDSRIGEQFLQPGVGYGGSCFPKDVAALLHLAQRHETPLQILEAVEWVNHTQHERFLEKVRCSLGDLSGKKLALLGLTFKPNTDDIREAPALKIIESLTRSYQDVKIAAYDPQGQAHVKRLYPYLTYSPTPEVALQGAHAALLITEWPQIVQLDWSEAVTTMATPYLFDGRNALDATRMKQLGYRYFGIGR